MRIQIKTKINIEGANLEGIKKYSENHDIFKELIKRENINTFSDSEWSYIGRINVHSLCEYSIKKRFNEKIFKVFEVLKSGFDEYYRRYLEIIGEGIRNGGIL